MQDKRGHPAHCLNRQPSASVLAEWVVAFCGALVVLLPVVDLANFLIGASVCNLIAFQAAAAAGPCSTIADSLTAMKNQTNNVANSVLGHLCKMKPVKGYKGCGVDLYVIVTNYSSDVVQVYGPNCGVPPPIDTSTYTYEYQAVCCYEIEPMLNLSFLSLFKDVSIVSKPTTLTYSCNRMVESPDGLAGPGVLAMFGSNGSSKGGSNGSSAGTPGAGVGTNQPGWNYPKLSYNTMIPSPDPNSPGFYFMNVYLVPGKSPGGTSVDYIWIKGHFVSTSSDARIPTQDQFQASNNSGSSFDQNGINPGQDIAPHNYIAPAVNQTAVQQAEWAAAEQFYQWCAINKCYR